MANFLDFQGLQQLVGLIKQKFVQKESGKSLSTNDYTNEERMLEEINISRIKEEDIFKLF